MNLVTSDSGAVLHLFCACIVRLQCQHPEVFQRNTAKCTVFLFVSKRIFRSIFGNESSLYQLCFDKAKYNDVIYSNTE